MIENEKKLNIFLLPSQIYFISLIIGLFSTFNFYISLIAIFTVLFISYNKEKKNFLIIIFYLLGALLIFIIHEKNKLKDHIPQNKIVGLKAEVKNIKTYPNQKTHIILKNVQLFYKDKKYKLHSYVLLKLYDINKYPLPNQKISGKFKIKPIRYYKNPGTFDYSKIYNLKNIHFVAFANNNFQDIKVTGNPNILWVIKLKLKEKLLKITENTKNKGLILSLIIGDRSYITNQDIEILQKASVLHIIAQSGLHVGFVAFIGYILVVIIGYFYQKIFLKIPKQKLGCLISGIFVLLYVLISEPRPSIIRAAIMFLTWATLFYFNIKYVIIDGLFLSLFIIFLYDPISLFEIGTQLSYLSVITIILFFPYIKSHILNKIKNRFIFYFIGLFFISTIIQIVLMPLILYYFGEISKNYLLNLFFIPVIGFIIFPCLFLTIIFILFNVDSFQIFIIEICDRLLTLLLNITKYLEQKNIIDSIPFFRPDGFMILGFYLFIVGIFLFIHSHKKKAYILGLISLILLCFPIIFKKIDKGIKVQIFDVGHGQSILLSYNNKRTLIDGGGTYKWEFNFGKLVLSPILAYKQLPKIENVILTHPDIDHIGGLFYIAKNYKIERFFYNGVKNKKSIDMLLQILKNKNVPIFTLQKGDIIYLTKDFKINVLNPSKDIIYDNENDSSLVLDVSYKNNSIIFITSDVSKRVLNNIIDDNFKTSIFVLPHHGSRKSFSLSYLKKLKAKTWVVSCGFLNRFNLPSRLWIDYAKRNKILFLSTAKAGYVEFKLKNGKISLIKEN